MVRIIKGLFPIILLSFVLVIKTNAGALEMFKSGNRCPEPDDPRLANVCGIVRSALPQDVYVNNQTFKQQSKPVSGVSVWLYECYPFAPTCKLNGNLTYPFSSTWTTDENGMFVITMRKLGQNNYQENDGYGNMVTRRAGPATTKRYLVFTCSGKLAAMQIIPSYKTVEINQYVDCPEYNSYSPPPTQLKTVDDKELACDMLDDEDTPFTQEVSYETGSSYTPQPVNYDFLLELEGADARYVTPENDPMGEAFANLASIKEADKGAWWSKDCLIRYEDKPEIRKLCLGGGTGEKEYPINDTLEKYKNELYTHPTYTASNKLPQIPIYDTLLMYKEFSARMDFTQYAQNPTKPAQWLHTHFGNCVGSVYLRKFGVPPDPTDPKSQVLDCEEFRKCNVALPEDRHSNDFRNYQTSGGYGSRLTSVIPYMQKYDEMDLSIPVCKYKGSEVTIGDIQPTWSYCQIGDGECPYKLSKEYFNPEFLYYYGISGSTGLYSAKFVPKNASFVQPPTGVNTIPWEKKEEASKGMAHVGGTSAVISSGGVLGKSGNEMLNTNNSIVAATDLATGGISNSSRSFTSILDNPAMTDKSMYLSGYTIYDKDTEVAHCTYSAVNEPDRDITPVNESLLTIYGNWRFKGNPDHWFSSLTFGNILPGEAAADISKKTPSTAIFFTTAGENRMKALKSPNVSIWNEEDVKRKDILDSILTASYGTGIVNSDWISAGDKIAAGINILLGITFGDNEAKTFFDREGSAAYANPMNRDDIQVDFSLSEETFTNFFPLPSPTPYNGETTRCDITNWLEKECWGESSAYPWKYIGIGSKCDTYKEGEYGISRTCKVQTCKKARVTASCDCVLDGNSVNQVNCDGVEDVSINITDTDCDSLPATDRLYCAQNQLTCLEEGGTSGGKDSIDCIKDNNKSRIQSIIDGVSCPDASDFYDETGVVVKTKTTESNSGTIPACEMHRAGPFAETGSIDKLANLEVKQQKIFEESSLYVDELTASDNLWKKFANPLLAGKSYRVGASGSANSSVNPNDPNGRVLSNRDIEGLGGAGKSEFMSLVAHPSYFDPEWKNMNPVQFHCNNPEIGGSGTWSCNLMEVPDPEIIPIEDLEGMVICRIQNPDACANAVGVMDLSPTFQTIVNAAASKFNLSPGVVMLYMKYVHTLDRFNYLWTTGGENALIEASLPWYGAMYNCDEMSPSAQGAHDWLSVWFEQAVAGGAIDPLNTISPGRYNTAARCNVLDSTFAIAFALSNGYTGGCYGWDYSRAESRVIDIAWGVEQKSGASRESRIAGGEAIFNACK